MFYSPRWLSGLSCFPKLPHTSLLSPAKVFKFSSIRLDQTFPNQGCMDLQRVCDINLNFFKKMTSSFTFPSTAIIGSKLHLEKTLDLSFRRRLLQMSQTIIEAHFEIIIIMFTMVIYNMSIGIICNIVIYHIWWLYISFQSSCFFCNSM